MEVRGEDPANPGCSSSARDRPGVPVSKELLTAGSGCRGGIWDKLLINAKPDSKKATTLQTVRVERSPLLEQVQSFLPQMAQANEKLRKEMAAAPPGHFNIENTDGTLGKVIQMDVALFEMDQLDSKEDHSEDTSDESSSSEDEDDSISCEVTVDNIKLPNLEGRRGKIEVLDSPASKKKK
ncbi:NOP protein chaperone 1 [Ochotona princeps]|uniref:NOP protein chaperone 1 n=1 Tax=Ochotona princeps TaxID=9978 RepID=UPI002714EA1F|nr:NOP protein chaperone 1 [Ochotona princeps]